MVLLVVVGGVVFVFGFVFVGVVVVCFCCCFLLLLILLFFFYLIVRNVVFVECLVDNTVFVVVEGLKFCW